MKVTKKIAVNLWFYATFLDLIYIFHVIVRMLSYIPGTILYAVEYTKELFYQVGQLTAKIDTALMVSGTHFKLK